MAMNDGRRGSDLDSSPIHEGSHDDPSFALMPRAADKPRDERRRIDHDKARSGPLRGAGSRALRRHGLVWGTSWIAMRGQVGPVAPEVSTLWRFALAVPPMWLWAAARGERLRYGAADHLRFAASGAFLFSCNLMLFLYAASYLPTGLLAVMFSLASIVNLVFGALFLGQPIEPGWPSAGSSASPASGCCFGRNSPTPASTAARSSALASGCAGRFPF